MNKLHHFYHIYSGGMWESPTKKHFKTLKESELINNLSTLNIGIVGPKNTRESVKEYLDSENIKYTVCAEVDSGWEQETQDMLYDFSQKNDGYVFYAHTKNAHKINPLHIAWRLSMTYHNVINWKDAVKCLDDGYAAFGCHYLYGGNGEVETVSGFYAGTFWWTHLKYIRNFPQKPSRKNRFGAEGWIGFLEPTVTSMGDVYKIYDCVPYHPIDITKMTTFW